MVKQNVAFRALTINTIYLGEKLAYEEVWMKGASSYDYVLLVFCAQVIIWTAKFGFHRGAEVKFFLYLFL